MSLGDVIKVPPHDLRCKLSADLHGILDGDWDLARVPLERTDKHRSVVQRYSLGVPWERTDVFRNQYTTRFARGETVRGAASLADLVAQYADRVDGLFADLKANGFRPRVDGRAVPIPEVHIGRDGEPLLGNNGNHRVAMAKVLGLDGVLVKVRTIHARLERNRVRYRKVQLAPELSDLANAIPAMTTQAERLAYYALARKCASAGAVVEMGAWLGASTAYIAAGMRDSGVGSRAQVYDRFVWQPAHEFKVRAWAQEHHGEGYRDGSQAGDALAMFKANLGPLLAHVDIHHGEIRDIAWGDAPVALMILDAPKRAKEISPVLTTFAPAVCAGTLMAWQDFAHFPSYEIVACLSRLDGAQIKFLEAIHPGTTAVFKVRKPWTAAQVSAEALSPKSWRADEIEAVWAGWHERLPEPLRARFACGAAMFLCDVGATERAVQGLRALVAAKSDEILPKWRYLREHRPHLVTRYAALFEVIPC